ncbi:hypothetical protein [Nocardia cyriacigeorgica]|uniref:Uncharacterized protein n=1 Tax=Nocardia cyriacigeorgica TaxID=135487 RepID=A0A5R8NF69_9NOCA|nr:hypothetical protein [Nocardia cyriacigeorgica]TLF74361.1 hypothetical protein FEK34_23535 [Nocardia cyriacigeorgica]
MNLPARMDRSADADESATTDESYRYLQRSDGSWSLVGADGWEVEFADLDADTLAAIAAAVALLPFDLDPTSTGSLDPQ